MRLPHGLCFCLATLTTATHVLAQDAAFPADMPPPDPPEAKQPVAYVERPLTLPAMTLSPQLDAAFSRVDTGRDSAAIMQMEAAGSFGITDDLMVELRPGGFVFGDVDADYTRFQFGIASRWLDGPVVELGARSRVQVDSNAIVSINPAIVMRIHAGKVVRIDTGLNFAVAMPTDRGESVIALAGLPFDYLKPVEAGIPLDVSFQLAEPVFLGFTTGYGVLTFEGASESSFMPLGIFAGGTVPGEQGPLADIGASFGLPLFLLGASEGNPNTELWTAGITVRGFLYL
jgi:hypothetical protein